MKYILLLTLFLVSCSLFSPDSPPTPDITTGGSDPLNLKGLFLHPSDSFDFTLYSELIVDKNTFFTDNGKSSYKKSSDFLKRLEFIKNSPDYKSIKVEWSGSSSGALKKDGSDNDLPERYCRIYLDEDTLEEKCFCKVRYENASNRWRLTYWEVVEKDGNTSFFNSEYSD